MPGMGRKEPGSKAKPWPRKEKPKEEKIQFLLFLFKTL
jgi:hypothetical protein